MSQQRISSHTVIRLTVHIVSITKYRYPVLTGEIKNRYRELIMQVDDAEDIRLLKRVVSKNHVHCI
jgi:putative transposase